MMCTRFCSAGALVLFATLVLAIQAAPARAEEPVFPPGSRVGLVPPPGMVVSKTFDGFADPAKDAAILITVGYKLYRGEGSSQPVSDVTATLPKGAHITSTVVTGDRVVVTVDTPAGPEVRTFDARTLKLTGRLRFATEP